MEDTVVYKILRGPEMAELLATGRFAGSPSDVADGFVHLSSAAQVPGVLQRHFAGAADLWIAAVGTGALGEALRWEPSSGGQLYPHLYAPLEIAAVTAHGRLEHGAIRLPGA
jgi:hypothetical protein